MLLARAVHHDRALVRAYVQFTESSFRAWRNSASSHPQSCKPVRAQAPKPRRRNQVATWINLTFDGQAELLICHSLCVTQAWLLSVAVPFFR